MRSGINSVSKKISAKRIKEITGTDRINANHGARSICPASERCNTPAVRSEAAHESPNPRQARRQVAPTEA